MWVEKAVTLNHSKWVWPRAKGKAYVARSGREWR